MGLLGTYDSWKANAPGTSTVNWEARGKRECPVCDGIRRGTPCSQACLLVVLQAETKRRIAGQTVAARRCLSFVRAYLAEGDDLTTPRTAAALWRVFELRDAMQGDRQQLRLYRGEP